MEGLGNFIAAALFINFLLVRVLTKVVKKPTGMGLIDDTILYLNTQDSFLLNSSLVLALVIFLADYWLAPESSSLMESMSPKV
jgi:energy-converting hydrogenase Eha subunit F